MSEVPLKGDEFGPLPVQYEFATAQNGFSLYERLEGVPREQEMLKGHLPRVIYHQVH